LMSKEVKPSTLLKALSVWRTWIHSLFFEEKKVKQKTCCLLFYTGDRHA